MKDWQYNVLFGVGVFGVIILLLGPEFGLFVDPNPLAVSGVGVILTYILSQKRNATKTDSKEEKTKTY